MMFNTTPPCVFFEPSNMDPYGTTCSMAMPTPPGIAIAVALFGTVESLWEEIWLENTPGKPLKTKFPRAVHCQRLNSV